MEDLIGKKFGRWTVFSLDTTSRKGSHVYYNCRCDCGSEKSVRLNTLLSGESQSCGCLQKELVRERATTHGMSRHPYWQAYYDMYRRCYDPKRKDFHHYGGKGIEVCDEWICDWDSGKGFRTFVEDMGDKPEGKSEIERVDRDGNYCKSNCYWEDRKAQTNNTSQNRMIAYEGFELTLTEWAHLIEIRAQIICDRLNKLGRSVEDALCTPPKIRGKNAKGLGDYRGIDFAINFLRTATGLEDAFSLSILRKINHE